MVGTFWKEKSRFQTLLVPLGSPLCVDCIVLPYKTECRVRNFHFSVKIKPHFLVKKSRKNAILKPLSFRRLRWEVGSGLMLFVRRSNAFCPILGPTGNPSSDCGPVGSGLMLFINDPLPSEATKGLWNKTLTQLA
jgi:hypothetical protein